MSKVFFELSNCLEPQRRTLISFKPGPSVLFMPFRVSGYPGRAASCRKPLHFFSSCLESVCFWPFSFQSWSRLSHQISARRGHSPRGSLSNALSKALFSFPTFWNVISHIRLPSDPPPFQDEAYRPCFPTQGSLAPTTAQLPQESANLSKSSCPVF